MKRGECGFAYPPADGTRDREIVDRFADFLAAVGPAPRRGERVQWRSAAHRYRARFLAWRMGQEPA